MQIKEPMPQEASEQDQSIEEQFTGNQIAERLREKADAIRAKRAAEKGKADAVAAAENIVAENANAQSSESTAGGYTKGEWEKMMKAAEEADKRIDAIQEAHKYIDSIENEQQDEIQNLVAELNGKLSNNLMVERANLTDTGFEIVIKNEKGEPVYGQDNLPPESWQAYDKLYYALEEKFKGQNPSARNSEPVITGKPQGLWSKIKKFFGGK